MQYDSCRSLEGWTVINYGYDDFWDYNPHVPAVKACYELVAARPKIAALLRETEGVAEDYTTAKSE